MPVIDKVSLQGTVYDINDTGARTNKVDNSVIAPVESGSTASRAYSEGEYFIKGGAFCTVIDDISTGDTLTENTNYTTGQLIDSLGGDLSNYIQKSATEGLVKNDGTIDTSKHVSLQASGVDLDGTVENKIWTGLTDFLGLYILTDGTNIYYSDGSGNNYVLDKSTSTWNTKILYGYTGINGGNIWTDGDNIYYSDGDNYVLDKSTSTWSTKTWTGLTNFYGYYIWTDGDNIYYSEGNSSTQYILNKSTSTWSSKTWSGYTNIDGSRIWTDGDNIYYSSHSSEQYVLDKSTSTWNSKTWNEYTDIRGDYVLTDGTNIYYSDSDNSVQYVLDKSTSTWTAKTWTGLTSFDGDCIWTDGDNIYHSSGTNQHVFIGTKIYKDGFVKSDGSIVDLPVATTTNAGTVKPDGTTITIDANGIISSTGDVILSATLTAGQTSVIINDARIHTDSYIDVYTNTYGVAPTDVTNAEGTMTLTFESQSSDVGIRVKLS